MTPTIRAAALAGGLAHAVGRVAGRVVWFAPRRTPWALVIAALLAAGALSSVQDAREVVAGQPRPEPVGLADVVDVRATGWVGTSTIVRGPFLDSASSGSPVQRWYYLLIDPRDEEVAIVARSPERLEERRTRTITARVTSDPAAVGAAVGALDIGALRVDPERYLVELPERRPAVLAGERVMTPMGLDGRSDGEVVLRGTFDAARPVPDGSGDTEYLVSDGGRATVVRSPYPPDALPVDVWGVTATDPVRVEQALAVPELQAALADRRAPDRRLLAEGVTPPLPQVSFVPAMILATLAAVLALGWLIGYPIFRRRAAPERLRTWRLDAGEDVAADLYGTDGRRSEEVVLAGAPARFQLLRRDERERRAWQFALRETANLAPVVADAAAERARLVLSSGQGPILVPLDPPPPGLNLAIGDLVHAGRSRAALRIRAVGLDLVAAFASNEERDRALAAIDPARLGELRSGAPPHSTQPPSTIPPVEGLPTPLRAAASVLGVLGALLVAGGGIGLPGALRDPGLAPSLAQLAIGSGILAVGRGVWRRRDWAHDVGFTVGWVGAAVAAFVAVAAPQCGLWLAPNLAACEAAGPVGSAVAIGTAVGLGYVALAVRRHAAAFDR